VGNIVQPDQAMINQLQQANMATAAKAQMNRQEQLLARSFILDTAKQLFTDELYAAKTDRDAIKELAKWAHEASIILGQEVGLLQIVSVDEEQTKEKENRNDNQVARS